MKQFTIVAEDISDGYHTFTELYDHRCWLWINLCLANADQCYWFDHYDGWPCLVWESPAGQMSYHIPSTSLLRIVGKIYWVYSSSRHGKSIPCPTGLLALIRSISNHRFSTNLSKYFQLFTPHKKQKND